MKFWKILILSFLIAGCAGNVTQPEEAAIDSYPENWPKPLQREFRPSECSDLNGEYYSSGLSNSNISKRFSDPVFERNFFYLNDIASKSNIFSVAQDASGKRLNFNVFDSERNLLAADLYKTYSRCELGRFVIESYVEGGSGDSPLISQLQRTEWFLAEDVSLLISSYLKAVSRKFIFGRSTEVSQTWYRFKKVD